jgi:hypothetical protein
MERRIKLPRKRNDWNPDEEREVVTDIVQRNESIAEAAARLNVPYYVMRRVMLRHGWIRRPRLVPTYRQEGWEWFRQQ